MSDIQTYFDQNYFILNEEAIYSINEQDSGAITNVIRNLEEHCYGVLIYDDKEFIEYLIFYIDNSCGLQGLSLMLSLKLDTNTRTAYTIEFCKLICDKFPNIDIVDAFNTIQSQTRTLFEKLNYFTISNELDKVVDNKEAVLLAPPGVKGVIYFPVMNKLELYNWFFSKDVEFEIDTNNERIKKVYLLLDPDNNLIKIGQSFYPSLREKTLQGVSPKWDLIAKWIAPIEEEKYLHNLFSNKRVRGEWFDLNFNDLRKIKEYMSKYKNSL